MHIPDGYLGPITCVAGYAAMIPVWTIASHKVKNTLQAKQVPLLAIGAAFSFVIMMFNIPIPGGTTGHAAGAVLVALLIGPWAATISISVALVIQALLFGDGGITAIGANCFNMAFVMPFTGYALYRLISGSSPVTSKRRLVAAGVAGYAGLVVASLCAGIEFGLQPLLHTTASGQALYCPYGLKVAITTMVGEHLLVFGWIELIATVLVVRFLQKTEPSLLLESRGGRMKTTTKLWIAIGVLAIVSPLGILLPEKFKAGSAWGEWSTGELNGLIGYVPGGLSELAAWWQAVLPDYTLKGWVDKGLGHQSVAYSISAILGIAFCVGGVWIIGKLLTKNIRHKDGPACSHKKASGFIDRTLLGIVGVLKDSVSNDEIASRPGFLQKCDARLKLLSIMVMIASVLCTRSIIVLSIIYAVTLAAVFVSSIRLTWFLKRTMLFIPLFSLFIVVPALFNKVTPGEPIVILGFFHDLSITRQGIGSATVFFLRVLTSVSLSILLMLTTRNHVLLKVLRVFKIPQVFVVTMGMTYRYIYLLLDVVQNTFVAIKSRVGYVSSTKTGRRIVGANMAGLWLKSYRMQSQVYSAMLARGYTGEPVVFDEFKSHITDFTMLIFSVLVLIGTLWLNHYLR